MKHFAFLLLALCLPALAAGCVRAAPPAYTLIEAEAAPQGTVKADPKASGGKYVARDGAYQPLMIADLPKDGDSFVVWARVRGTALQLKGVAADGTQKELNWVYDKPAAWTWESFGRHTRAELGAKLLLMQGADAQPDAGLDAALLAADDSFTPATLHLDLPPAAPISVSVNWQKTVAQATPLSYGLNAFGGFNPETTHNAVYEANMANMGAGILRLHNWDMMGDSATPNGWVDTAHRRWDATKINRDLAGAYAYGPALMINIPGWPAWMDTNKDGFLDADKTADYARFCAELVRIVSKDAGHRVLYWEVTNEKDGQYYSDFHQNGGPLKDPAKPDRVADLAAIYNACARAMKAVDPAIKVGGPAVTQPYLTDFITRFAAATVPSLDFFSYHAYATGSRDTPDKDIYDASQAFGASAKRIAGILQAVSPQRAIPVFFDEYNISWTWETHDPRMTDIKGAVFDALSMASAVTDGAAATVAWNDKDDVYGKMGNDFQPRPSMQVFHFFNRCFVGAVVETASADPEAVVAYAVKSAVPSRESLLLINRTNDDQSVRVKMTSPGPGLWRMVSLSGSGGEEEETVSAGWTMRPLHLPANSLIFFIRPAAPR